MSGTRESYKAFNDPVHGTILLHPLLVKIIDTPQFQRLRNIKQLGATYYVYPGAQHNRFEHSIGTAHLAGKLVRHLKETQPELKINDKEVLCVEIAGLCHDVGHGPYSHLFDGMVMKRLQGKKEKFRHEAQSCRIFKDLICSIKEDDEYKKSGLSDKDHIFITAMIDSKQEEGAEGRRGEKGYLYEIVSNKETGVDVDKWDYFARDCHHLGIANNFDHNRFIQFTRVIKCEIGKMRIGVRDKEIFNLYEMFHTRFTLHKRAYQHKVKNAIDHMICDAMVKTEGHFKTSSSVSDLAKYNQLDDDIFRDILRYSVDGSADEESDQVVKDCKEAKSIMENVERRKLYRCVRDEILPQEAGYESDIKKGIFKFSELNPECFGLSMVVLDYGKGAENPVDNYWFYKKEDATEFPICGFRGVNMGEISMLIPRKFQEHRIQVFSKRSEHDELLGNAFDGWKHEVKNK